MLVTAASSEPRQKCHCARQNAARRCCRQGNTLIEGSGSRRWGRWRKPPVRRLLRIGRTGVSEDRKATGFYCRRQNSDHVHAALGEASVEIGTHRLRRRIAARAILLLCRILGRFPVPMHGLHAVAHRIIGRRTGRSRCLCHACAHLRSRPRRGDRRERQSQGDQHREDGAQEVQGDGSS